jgi:hypothetical protein
MKDQRIFRIAKRPGAARPAARDVRLHSELALRERQGAGARPSSDVGVLSANGLSH